MTTKYLCVRCGGEVEADVITDEKDEKYEIGMSALSDSAQRKAEQMMEAEDRPVYAKRHGSGHRLAQIHFISPHSEQYAKDEARLWRGGWRRVVND
jgi:hypothetical protein